MKLIDKLREELAQIAARHNSARRRFIQYARHPKFGGDVRKFKRAKADLARARYQHDTLMMEWAMAHPHIGTGLCPICEHAGSDCTGKKGRCDVARN